MAEARSRKEMSAPRPRSRARPENPSENGELENRGAESAPANNGFATDAPEPRKPARSDSDTGVLDDEINTRY